MVADPVVDTRTHFRAADPVIDAIAPQIRAVNAVQPTRWSIHLYAKYAADPVIDAIEVRLAADPVVDVRIGSIVSIRPGGRYAHTSEQPIR